MKREKRNEQLRELLTSTGLDFAAVADVFHGVSTILTWTEAAGNRNDNYQKIVLEPGKGIAGGVYKMEKTIVVQDTESEYKEEEMVHAPILMAEAIRSYAAFPLRNEERVEGVLLLAMRSPGAFTKNRYDQIFRLVESGVCGMQVQGDSYETALYALQPQQPYKAVPIYELVDIPIRKALCKERHRIARDLHDSVIQNLTGVQMLLRTLAYAEDKEEIRKGLRIADESLGETQKELREILVNVRPAIVEDIGLTAALQAHFRFLEQSFQVTILFNQNIENRRFEAEVETVIYRTAQEAAANACKYAEADRIDVSLRLTDDVLRLVVTDRGKGFGADQVSEGKTGMGLPGMQYWADSVGGKLAVRSLAGEGTEIRLEVPVLGKTGGA